VAGREAAVIEPLLLASTSPQRRAILTQLRVPFEVVSPDYIENDPPDADPVELVRTHAEGKARSAHREGRVTLGVDTTVHLAGRVYGKPQDRADAGAILQELSGRTHEVISGLCLVGPGFGVVEHAITEVEFRLLSATDVETYLGSGEWKGRAGGYAVQGRGGRLVRAIRGDYLNVVGLPAALLIETLERHLPAALAFAPPTG
jgi:septum formation protein